MGQQLTFDLPVRPALGRGAFFVSPANATAVATIEDWRTWPQGRLVLIGAEGAGKTHLAHVWAGQTGAAIVTTGALADADLTVLAAAPLVIEDVQHAAGNPEAERMLFHLHNLMRETGQPLLCTASAPPARLPLVLPDLASRMQASALAEIGAPDDALLAAVLVKQFSDRQIAVSPPVVTYLVRHMPRSFGAVSDIVAALDRAALAKGKAVTRQLARQVLDKSEAARE